MDISFDDLLAEEPAKKTSVKLKDEPVKAGRPFRRKEHRETPANWDAPKPEAVILFWTSTTCDSCGEVYSAPTYAQNSTLVRYRVSRFRTLLRPYSKGLEVFYRDLPRLKEVTHSTVRFCTHCFDEHAETLDALADQYCSEHEQFVGPLPGPLAQSCSELIKPFVDVDYTDTELHTKQRN